MTKVKTEIKRSTNLVKKGNVLRETFGKVKFKKSTEKMMKEMDRDLYDI